MIKSKRKTVMFPSRKSKATRSTCKYQDWDFLATPKNIVAKFKVTNYKVDFLNSVVNRDYKQGDDLVDV